MKLHDRFSRVFHKLSTTQELPICNIANFVLAIPLESN